jgi:hypothetical protein
MTSSDGPDVALLAIDARQGGASTGEPAGGGGEPAEIPAPGSQEITVEGPCSLQARGMHLGSSSTFNARAKAEVSSESATDRADHSENHHIFARANLFMKAEEVTLVAKKIVLRAGGSSIVVWEGGVSITSAGPVTVNGGKLP